MMSPLPEETYAVRPAQEEFDLGPPPDDIPMPTGSGARFALPKIDPTVVVTSRLAGRMNAASVSEAEHRALLRERQELLNKRFDNTITRKESNRLEYVRWSLDRIEDARHGGELDYLEAHIESYERLVTQIRSLERQLQHHLPRKR
jgi:hypothetical protein